MTAPPFTGSIDFKLAIGAFDVRVLRKARLGLQMDQPPSLNQEHVFGEEFVPILGQQDGLLWKVHLNCGTQVTLSPLSSLTDKPAVDIAARAR